MGKKEKTRSNLIIAYGCWLTKELKKSEIQVYMLHDVLCILMHILKEYLLQFNIIEFIIIHD